jgi:hypothetical protein
MRSGSRSHRHQDQPHRGRNLYSSRHYDTDELIERMKHPRARNRKAPADVLLTVDAGRMWRADEAWPVVSRSTASAQ